MYAAAIVFARGNFFIFGGYADDHPTDVVAKLDQDTKQWDEAGRINNARFAHGAIVTEDQFLIIGGSREEVTERCYLVDDELNCTLQEPTLTEYRHWPELFLIDDDYCNSN